MMVESLSQGPGSKAQREFNLCLGVWVSGLIPSFQTCLFQELIQQATASPVGGVSCHCHCTADPGVGLFCSCGST